MNLLHSARFYLCKVAVPCVSSCSYLPRQVLSMMGNTARNTSTFLFSSLLAFEVAELKYPAETLKFRRIFNLTGTPIENFFAQEELHQVVEIRQTWAEGKYVALCSIICDITSNFGVVYNWGEFLGVLDRAKISAAMGRIPLMHHGVAVGLDTFCSTMSLVGKIFAIISVCKDVRNQDKPIQPSQKTSLIFSSVVLTTKLSVIIGSAYFGWSPSQTTLNLFSITRTVCNLTRAYTRNTELKNNKS